MTRRLAFALVYLCAAVPVASAQTSTSNSTSDANTTTNAGSVATSQAGTSSAVINQFQNTPSHTDATIHNVPNTGGIALFGGTNPCTVGAAGSVSAVGVGVGFGGQWSARGCERRNAAVILFQANMPDVAVAVLCEDADIRNAFRSSGRPCPQDVRTAAATSPVAANSAAPVQPVAATNAAATAQPMAAAQTRVTTPAAAQAAPLAVPAPVPAPASSAATAPGSQYASVTVTTTDSSPGPGQSGYHGSRPAWCNYPTGNSSASDAARAYYCH